MAGAPAKSARKNYPKARGRECEQINTQLLVRSTGCAHERCRTVSVYASAVRCAAPAAQPERQLCVTRHARHSTHCTDSQSEASFTSSRPTYRNSTLCTICSIFQVIITFDQTKCKVGAPVSCSRFKSSSADLSKFLQNLLISTHVTFSTPKPRTSRPEQPERHTKRGRMRSLVGVGLFHRITLQV